jgi:pimeloyl-ACP methyl ester carboxylesterase
MGRSVVAIRGDGERLMNTSKSKRAIYLCGLAGSPAPSPAIEILQADGWEIINPDVPGFNGKTGFMPPDNYMDWLTIFWDAIDATGALPCPIIGASVGAMMAAELAIFRPEAVTALALLGPFGIADANNMGQDIYALPASERSAHLFSKGVPEAFTTRFAELGPDEAPVAKYLSDVAAANMLWPLGDRGLIKRHHRINCPKLIMHGELDELIPVETARLWGNVTIVPGAGHLLEWDTPEVVGAALTEHLSSL